MAMNMSIVHQGQINYVKEVNFIKIIFRYTVDILISLEEQFVGNYCSNFLLKEFDISEYIR